jgi:hypothetical protein
MGDNFFENTMAHKWFQTKYEGIRFREHPSRMFGIRKDRYFVVRYRVDGTRKEEALGWESQNDSRDKDGSKITMLEVARATLAKLKEAHRTGEGPGTLADQRHQAALAKEEVERQREIEKIKNVTLAEYWPRQRKKPNPGRSMKASSRIGSNQYLETLRSKILTSINGTALWEPQSMRGFHRGRANISRWFFVSAWGMPIRENSFLIHLPQLVM